jgi:lipopolysaccharide export system protein LptA
MFIDKKFKILSMFSLMMVVLTANALQSDAKEPITLESNSVFFDDKHGVSIYQGKVIIIQGSLRMDADKVVAYMDDKREIQKLIVTGNPVKIKQTPELGKDDLNGEAKQVAYYPAKALLILEGQAVLWQGGNKTVSEYIEYDGNSEVIKAGDRKMTNKRVHITLQPSNGSNKD